MTAAIAFIARWAASKAGPFIIIGLSVAFLASMIGTGVTALRLRAVTAERNTAQTQLGAAQGALATARGSIKTLKRGLADATAATLAARQAGLDAQAASDAETARIRADNAVLVAKAGTLAAKLRAGAKSGKSQVTPEVWSQL